MAALALAAVETQGRQTLRISQVLNKGATCIYFIFAKTYLNLI